jgi:hypothetical protein
MPGEAPAVCEKTAGKARLTAWEAKTRDGRKLVGARLDGGVAVDILMVQH